MFALCCPGEKAAALADLRFHLAILGVCGGGHPPPRLPAALAHPRIRAQGAHSLMAFGAQVEAPLTTRCPVDQSLTKVTALTFWKNGTRPSSAAQARRKLCR